MPSKKDCHEAIQHIDTSHPPLVETCLRASTHRQASDVQNIYAVHRVEIDTIPQRIAYTWLVIQRYTTDERERATRLTRKTHLLSVRVRVRCFPRQVKGIRYPCGRQKSRCTKQPPPAHHLQ